MIKKKSIILINTETFNKKNFYNIKSFTKNNFKLIFNKKKITVSPNYLNKFKEQKIIGIIAGLEDYNKKIINLFKNLKIISRFGVGIDNLDLKTLKEKKIVFKTTNNSTPYATAEYAFSLTVNLLRKININDQNLKKKKWIPNIDKTLKDKTIGILGHGKVGKISSQLFKKFNCKVLIHDKKKINNKVSIQRLFKESDVISVHLNLNKNTNNLIGKNLMRLMKKSALLVNTSRGEIINENDLFFYLKKRKISGAALDCFTVEPYSGKLTKLDNIILSPHVASNTVECRKEMELESSKNLYTFFKKKKFIKN